MNRSLEVKKDPGALVQMSSGRSQQAASGGVKKCVHSGRRKDSQDVEAGGRREFRITTGYMEPEQQSAWLCL